MSSILILVILLFYGFFLFLLAYLANGKGANWIKINRSPYVYALSLGVYCSAWTFYGSLSSVSNSGLDFLVVYLGPSLILLLAGFTLKKMVRIAKKEKLTSISDFLAARYGKSPRIAVLVTFVAFIAVIPYISLQIKAVEETFKLISNHLEVNISSNVVLISLFLVILFFAILFGTRNITQNERNPGLVVSVVFESLFKLFVLIVAALVIIFLYLEVPLLELVFSPTSGALPLSEISGYGNWFWHLTISGFAFILLPRQFQMGVVEAGDPEHVDTASWLTPFYLFLIVLFTIPLAILGISILGESWQVKEYGILELSLGFGNEFLALFVFLGGYSAAFGMIVVELIAVSIMVTNSVILPYGLRFNSFRRWYAPKSLAFTKLLRRLIILTILLLGFTYYVLISKNYPLTFTGYSAFLAIFQLSPALILGLYWRNASSNGIFWGMFAGITLCILFLLIPNYLQISQSFFSSSYLVFVENFYMDGFDPISSIAFWSLLINVLIVFIFSNFKPNLTSIDLRQASIFVDANSFITTNNWTTWRGKSQFSEINKLLYGFLGKEEVEKRFRNYLQANSISADYNGIATPEWLSYVESELSGMVGSTSARMLLSSVSNQREIQVDELLQLLQFNKSLQDSNLDLSLQNNKLEELRAKLEESNTLLEQADNLKNEFLATVVHEIRSPLTAIRAMSEILKDGEELDPEIQDKFLQNILNEIDRLGKMVDEILELERYYSGVNVLEMSTFSLNKLVEEVVEQYGIIAQEKGIHLKISALEKSIQIEADKKKISQVLINLLSNSVKYAKPKDGKIEIRLQETKNEVFIEVEDNGIGISSEGLNSAFTKFFRAENSIQYGSRGSGLGLAITKAILDLHGSEINLKSTLHVGTLVHICMKKQNDGNE